MFSGCSWHLFNAITQNEVDFVPGNVNSGQLRQVCMSYGTTFEGYHIGCSCPRAKVLLFKLVILNSNLLIAHASHVAIQKDNDCKNLYS